MSNVISAIQHTIPISQFNRGLAGKIFSDIKLTGSKVVMKNNVAECVLISPDEYVHMIDELNDLRLLLLASERIEHYDPSKNIPLSEIDHEFGFTEADLTDFNEVEFE